MPECPYCGKWFRSNKALKQHITKAHTVKTGMGTRMLAIGTVEPFGAMERRAKRRKRRGLF